MSLIQSLMKRRQFLALSGMASASALTMGKLAAETTPASPAHGAPASGKPATAKAGVLSDRYSHVLSPIKIGNQVLKNRMIVSMSTPHFLQGNENFPSEIMRDYYVNMARNGAAVISLRIMQNRERKTLKGDSAHMLIYDLSDFGVQNYFEQMIEGIHVYGSKASAGLDAGMGPGSAQPDLSKLIETAVTQAKFYQAHGVDVLQVGIRGNQKGSLEIIKAVKQAVPEMLINTEVFVRDATITPRPKDGYYSVGVSIEDAIAYAHQLEGLADILMVRVADSSAAHPTPWNSTRGYPYSAGPAAAIKKAGVKIAIAPGGGFHDPDINEELIANGKADLITMARAFVNDWQYAKKLAEGRGEDVTPCIRCNKCHGESFDGPWYTVCSVNPEIGLPSAAHAVPKPGAPKKVAVIGGGPAGMKAALVAAERGHKVAIYEKGPALGGQMLHSEYSPYKWPIKDLKDYQISHLKSAGVEIVLNTQATPEMIKAKGYDSILVGIGSEPIIPKISGVNGAKVHNIIAAYSKEKSLGKNVVVIGTGETAADIGIFLAKAGHNVTMLTGEKKLIVENRPHYPGSMVEAYEDLKNFSVITEGTARAISTGSVSYADAAGSEKTLPADDVVVFAGFAPKKEEALKFYGSAKQFFTIGDCSEKGGNIQKCTRSAFFAATEV
jgi:2,4-dienoyl-CoA reductase-like NADH-dependent reductase (Old Yellow Enzyme family)/thioredoxin reductase